MESDQTPQIIHFTNHAPAVPSVQCCIFTYKVDDMRHGIRCEQPAVWGLVFPHPTERRYILTAYCDQHFRTWDRQQERHSAS